MSKLSWIIGVFCLALGPLTVSAADQRPLISLETSMGPIIIRLEPEKAPASVENFLSYLEEGFYDGTVFHRVIKEFVIQGGGFDEKYQRKGGLRPAIKNEADNGLKNSRGSVAMARTGAPHSATSQFYISVKDNGMLDHRGKNPRGWGYAVFGEVVEGMDTVDKIRVVRTGKRDMMGDVPVESVVLKKASVVGGEELAALRQRLASDK